MHVIYIAITILAALANGYAASLSFAGAESIKVVADKVEVSQRWMIPFGLLLASGAVGREVVDAFFAASRDGDFDALLAVLDPVAGHTATYADLYPYVRPALVNGAAGAVVAPGGRLFSVMAFTVTGGRITRIDALADPERLARLGLTTP